VAPVCAWREYLQEEETLMLNYELLPGRKVLIVEPQAALEAADFKRLVQAVDPFIEQAGGLNGLMIYSDSFPGWDDFQALVSHIRFISNHHQAIRRVAFVTDSAVLTLLPRMASHFVAAEVRHFRHADREAALDWLSGEQGSA
jgi:hypothetical protein